MSTNEQLYAPVLRGPMSTEAQSQNNQWAGRTTLGSGSSSVTVSTNVVNSDSIILLGIEAASRVSSNTAIEVGSINPTNAFVLTTGDGNAMARDTTIMWTIMKTS